MCADRRKRASALWRYSADEAAPAISFFLFMAGAVATIVGAREAVVVPSLDTRLAGTAMFLVGASSVASGFVLAPPFRWNGRYHVGFIGSTLLTLMIGLL